MGMEGYFPRSSGDEADGPAFESATKRRPAPRSRDSLFLLARLTLKDGSAVHEVRVRNLSAGGMMAEYDGRVAIGDPVTAELRGLGEVTGRVAWAAEGRVGIALDEPIDPKKARKPIATRARR